MNKTLAVGVVSSLLILVPLVGWAAQFAYREDRLVIREPVQEDLYAASGQVVIDAPVAGDVYVTGGSVRIDADVTEDLHVAGGQVVLNGNIAGDVVAVAGNLEITEGASVGGELVVAVGELVIDPGANVQGSVTRYQPPVQESNKFAGVLGGSLLWVLSSLIMTLLLGYGLPNKSAKLAADWRAKFGMNILWGLVFMIVVPIIIVLLMITVVGIPLGLIALAGYAVMMYVAKLVAALAVGTWLQSLWTKKDGFDPIWSAAVIGVLVIALVSFVPIVGWLAVCLVFLAALGSLIRFDWNLVQILRKQKEI